MRKAILLVSMLLSSMSYLNSQATGIPNPEFPVLQGQYFDQKPPGITPKIFANGVISQDGRYEYGVSFSPQFDELFFTVEKVDEGSSIYFSKLENGAWTNPEKANFTEGKKRFEMEAFVSPDGNRIYFTAYDSMNVNIWYVDRLEGTWSDAELLDLPIKQDIVFYANAAVNGDIYYTNYSKQGIYFAPYKDNEYSEIHPAGIEYGGHGYIAPTQDFILIDAFKNNDSTKDRDIHVCFKMNEGKWSIPINLGNNVNSNYNETCPSISPDGKYLFFSRYDESGGLSNIYWVDTKFIENLKPSKLKK